MALRCQCLLFADRVNYADKILETLMAETEGKSQRAEEIHHLVKDLRNILDLAERTASDVSAGKENSDLTQLLRELQCKSEWQQFDAFMNRCATQTPPPPYIFRAERHGDPFPRFEDDFTGKLVSSFASDMHACMESVSESEIMIATHLPCDMSHTVSDLVGEVAMHLKKTQINKCRASRAEERYLSQLISLSGSFHWALHTTCLKGRTATEGQEAGLAIFDTSKIKASGIHLWRVRDLLTFFRSNTKFDSSRIDPLAKEWAMNSDEYVCWDFVPKIALVQFLPYERLVFRSDYPDDYFLRTDFVAAASLGDFKKRFSSSAELLTVDQYRSRVRSIVMKLTYQCPVKDVDSFVEAMVEWFSDPASWGYKLNRDPKLRPMFQRIIRFTRAR
ncbi:MAG: hypothetical protein Q9179_007330 [Wetmoreana sp. 5 TL-2023]